MQSVHFQNQVKVATSHFVFAVQKHVKKSYFHFISSSDGSCILLAALCNGNIDCRDGSDENGCPCREDEFTCAFNGVCIDANLHCDGIVDCADKSDEIRCPTTPPRVCEPPVNFQCPDTRLCITRERVCDGIADCPGRADEEDCSEQPCAGVQCLDGTCISNRAVCDGVEDCRQGEDEVGCPGSCLSTEFKVGVYLIVVCCVFLNDIDSQNIS